VIKANKFNAICGTSGGGKTTVLNLLLKLYHPENGCILINGVDIQTISQSSILQRVGYVGQDTIMFDETINENISVGLKKPIETAQINQLMSTVNSGDFYPPKTTSETLGLKGCNLSGGQRQRLAIARALGRNNCEPNILILDEATAALDGKNEEEVQKILNSLLERKDCTLIVVAHRLSTIKNADVINVLSQGNLVENGTHIELMKLPQGI